MKHSPISKHLFTSNGAVRLPDVCQCLGGIALFRPLLLRGWGVVPFDGRYWFAIYREGESGFCCSVFRLAEPVLLCASNGKGGGTSHWAALLYAAKDIWGWDWESAEPRGAWLAVLLTPHMTVSRSDGDHTDIRMLSVFAETVAKTWFRLSTEERRKVPLNAWRLGEFANRLPRVKVESVCT
ncbi:MAG: hypothetical protein ACOYOU_15665 [Kiritimatiellia bacterium]